MKMVFFYAESFHRADINISLVYEFIFKKINENTCDLASRFLNANEEPLSEEIKLSLLNDLRQTTEKLKELCEKKESLIIIEHYSSVSK